MVAVWVVGLVLVVGVAVAACATRRSRDEVEPSVRAFTEFRDAISRQVSGAGTDTRGLQRHVDRTAGGRSGDPRPREAQTGS